MGTIDEALNRLSRIGGETLVRTMITAFRSDVTRRIDALREAQQSADHSSLEQLTHSLKSSAGNVGAEELMRQAASIEELAADGGSGQLSELVDSLIQSLNEVDTRLDQELSAMGKKRIAVVEDNPDNRLLVHAILEDRYSILEYATGAEALSGIRREKPDLILLDISLPGMDGTEVLKRLRAEPESAKLPVVALTAHAMAGDRQHYLDIGFNEYISKPIVDEDVLLKAIESLLSELLLPEDQ